MEKTLAGSSLKDASTGKSYQKKVLQALGDRSFSLISSDNTHVGKSSLLAKVTWSGKRWKRVQKHQDVWDENPKLKKKKKKDLIKNNDPNSEFICLRSTREALLIWSPSAFCLCSWRCLKGI